MMILLQIMAGNFIGTMAAWFVVDTIGNIRERRQIAKRQKDAELFFTSLRRIGESQLQSPRAQA